MFRSKKTLFATAIACFGLGCAPLKSPVTQPDRARVQTCRGLVDGSGQASSVAVRWDDVTSAGDRRALDASCSTVGPGVYQPPPGSTVPDTHPIESLAIVSWNMHVGGGRLADLVADLRRGAFTNGAPVTDFVVLLQEAFRGGAGVPREIPDGISVPARIGGAGADPARLDIVRSAHALGLSVFYQPSMRNGDQIGAASEDRGNAILSTMPLSDLTAIELPYSRQRRVAIAAVMSGHSPSGAWTLQVVSLHLNASTGASHLWFAASGLRAKQARRAIHALDDGRSVPAIVGADLNTWSGGTGEGAFVELKRVYGNAASGPNGLRGALDHVFFRLPAAWRQQSQMIDNDYGSDHRPIVGTLSLRAHP